ncbi:MAG TPA: HAD hydrolase-like protein [Tangfeifania sp.]|nr:HAD hydrolase-like protein [Tangfeifania sp.]
MSHFSHIIFDLDGTLTDNTRGIENSVRYALKKMQVDNFDGVVPEQFIGPPLQWSFRNIYGMNERNTELAVEYFREYYSVNGKFENDPYPGIFEMLEELHFAGKKMYLATSKLEKFALEISAHFGFDKYISDLKGADYKGKNTKITIISDLLNEAQISPSKSIVMIGDTLFDIKGGQQNGLSTIAVTYGFGEKDDLEKAGPDYLVESVEELYELLV